MARSTDPKYAAGQVVDGRTICGAKKKDLDPCGASPVKGAKRCGNHGGKGAHVQADAARRIAEQEAQELMTKAVTTLGLKGKDIDPATALLEEISWTYAHVQWLRGKVQELTENQPPLVRGTEERYEFTDDGDTRVTEANDESGNPGAHALVWGQTEYRDKTGGDDAGQTVVEQAGLNIWYQLYMKEREHLAKVSALALRAGIEERKIKLAESQGELVAAVLKRILNALDLTPAQWEQVPVIVPRELRALASLE